MTIKCRDCRRELHPTDERQPSLTGAGVRCLRCVEWNSRERTDQSGIMERFDTPAIEMKREESQ